MTSIIVTTEPNLFSKRFQTQLGGTVFIYDNSAEALNAMLSHQCSKFFADFRELADRWSGPKFLRHLKQHGHLSRVQFWLMADQWYSHQEEWAIHAGAAGMIRRSAEALAERILGAQSPRVSTALAMQLAAVDAVFGTFAGPMRSIHVDAAREAFAAGRIAPSRDAYIDELAAKFALADRRASFLAAVGPSSHSDNPLDQADPQAEA